jgi:cellulose synthase (UDP-forming)
LIYFLPYFACLEAAFILGFWGQNVFKSRAWAIADFSIQIRAFWSVIRGKEIKFTVTPKERRHGIHWHLLWPHLVFFAINLLAFVVSLATSVSTGTAIFEGGKPLVLFWALFNAWNMWQPIQAGLRLRNT